MKELLVIAGVPEELHQECLDNLKIAEERSRGMTWHKFKVKILNAGKLAKKLKWEDNRLIYVDSSLEDQDVAPMKNITANGDNGVWVETPEGGRPIEDYWLDKDPNSEEYKFAVSKNYWCPGEHPRSEKSRKAWYRRNGGEFLAWKKGWPLADITSFKSWSGKKGNIEVTVDVCDGGWMISSSKTYGPIVLQGQYGFEVGNIYHPRPNNQRVQAWYPLDGYELKATITWSTIPRFKG